jgi:LacI family transcriptional regulator
MVFHITNGSNPINTHNVGGVIFADVIENRKQVESALALGTPCLVINNKVDDLNVSYIAVDNVTGGKIAGDYLVSLGHKSIATVTGNLNTQAGKHRHEGFKDVLAERNIELPEEYISIGDYSRRSARSAAEGFLKLPRRPTAVFAASDEMAMEVITVIMENGLKVPEDISVIGFDDNPVCLFGAVALTTVKQPLFKMAEDSVHLLSLIIAGKEKARKKIILTPELVIRESCARPKS